MSAEPTPRMTFDPATPGSVTGRNFGVSSSRSNVWRVGRFHSTPSQSAPLVVPPDLRRARASRANGAGAGVSNARGASISTSSRPKRRPPRRSTRRTRSACRAGPAARLAGCRDFSEFPRETRFARVRVRGRVDARRGGREGLADRRVGRDERGRRHQAVRLVPSLPRAFRRASRRAFRRARGRGPEVKKRREAGSRHPRSPETRFPRRGRPPTRPSRVRVTPRGSLREC